MADRHITSLGPIIIDHGVIKSTGSSTDGPNKLRIRADKESLGWDQLTTIGVHHVKGATLDYLMAGDLPLSGTSISSCRISCENDRLTITFCKHGFTVKIMHGVMEEDPKTLAYVLTDSGSITSVQVVFWAANPSHSNSVICR